MPRASPERAGRTTLCAAGGEHRVDSGGGEMVGKALGVQA
jgi:hypothetical protein